MRRSLCILAMVVPAAMTWVGCQSLPAVTETVATVGVATGVVTEQQAGSIVRAGEALASAMEQLTPENEYWIGRAVAATLLTQYRPLDQPNLNRYLNLLGQSLALCSDRPETFGGYRFLALDTDEINAFAGPGGFILVTRGMLRLCKTEDELAAVLAHEIGHVVHRHGLRAIQRSRWTGAFTTVLAEAGKALGPAELAEAVRAFEGSISDVTQMLVHNGYGRAAEREADATAVTILQRGGYDPRALISMLQEMKRRWPSSGIGFARTHPDPLERIRDVERWIGSAPPVQPIRYRQERFQAAMRLL
jgi:predicted Zn-dependent protease